MRKNPAIELFKSKMMISMLLFGFTMILIGFSIENGFFNFMGNIFINAFLISTFGIILYFILF